MVTALMNSEKPRLALHRQTRPEGTNQLCRKDQVPVTKVQHNTCEPWCVQHDDDNGCVAEYRFTPLSLETPVTQFRETRPAQMHLVLETDLDGNPVVVTYPTEGTGVTMTPIEVIAYAAQLNALAAMALGVA